MTYVLIPGTAGSAWTWHLLVAELARPAELVDHLEDFRNQLRDPAV